ncbi:LuxR C-terminal-related transcriptional regulator [Conyzicola sp.]|uniref:helix-turn-helix transcriptional regulator n=1 Tax=Conyzicola sp. TaxID=1969404 RepID=UPI003988A579
MGSVLDAAGQAELITVWATAGAGKTTLLSSWADDLRHRGEAVAWLNMSGTRSDDKSLEALVEQAFADVPDGAGQRAIFIDDAHLVSGHGDRLWLSQLASDPAPGVRAIVAGRYQPVPMPQLPNGHRLIELRSGDLAFTASEAASFFDQRGIRLSSGQLRKILERTDGWAVALAMMADRLESTADVDTFIDEFSADHRSVADYLVTEVMARQPDARKRFLMQTSVVDQLSVPLAVHLTGRSNAGELLEELEQENTLVRKDDGPSPTFHYHALLRSHLQAQLLRHDYADATEMHRSAAEWFTTHGRPDLALEQALCTDDPTAVSQILEMSGTNLVFAGKTALVRRALRAAEQAGASSATTDVLEVMLAAPNFFDRLAANHHLALANERKSTLPPHLHTIYAALVAMRVSGAKNIDVALAQLDLAESAMDFSPADPLTDEAALDAKIFAEAARGCAELERGNGANASLLLQAAAQSAGMDQRPWLALLLLDMAAKSAASAGRWPEVSAVESLMTSTVRQIGKPGDLVSALAQVTVAAANYASCEEVSPARLSEVVDAGERTLDAGLIVPGRVLATLMAVDGNPNPRSAFDNLDRILQGAAQLHPRMLATSAYRYVDLTFRFRGKQRAREVVRLVGSVLGVDSTDYRLVTALLQGGTSHESTESLELESALENGARVWYPSNLVLGWLTLGHWAEASGRSAVADARLHRALELAEQMQSRRPFMASAGMGARLIEQRLGRLGTHEVFAQTVTAAYARIYPVCLSRASDAAILTRKEHEILRELPHHQSISDIAGKQQLSANTIKTHLRSIYQKFGVSGRSEAVNYAMQAGLI